MRIAVNPPLWAKHFCYLQKCWWKNFLWISEGGEMKTRGKKADLHHSLWLRREELNFIRMSAVYWPTPVSEIPVDCFSDFSFWAEMSIITIVAILVFLTIPEGESNHKCALYVLPFVAACSVQTLCELQSAVRLTGYPSLTSHYLRYQLGGSRSCSAMPVHHKGEKAHWTSHWTGRGEPCQLSLQRNWDYVSSRFKVQQLFW